MSQLNLVQLAPPEADAASRGDFDLIARMVHDGASVLDVGCGDGGLMKLLAQTCGARVCGLDLDKANVRACIRRGLSVVQGDADAVLADYPSGAFNYVILSHTLQSLPRPHHTLRHAARVGEKVIVSIRNAGHWRNRWRLVSTGHVTPDAWADGGAMRASSVRDFAELVRKMRFTIETAAPLSKGQPGAPFAKTLWRANLFAEEAVFLIAP